MIKETKSPYSFKIQLLFNKGKISESTVERAKFFIDQSNFKMRKVKIVQMPDENKVKVFAEVSECKEALKVYDFFFKGKFEGVKTSVYFILEDDLLREYTLREIERHEEKK